jgi:hypothetical protein
MAIFPEYLPGPDPLSRFALTVPPEGSIVAPGPTLIVVPEGRIPEVIWLADTVVASGSVFVQTGIRELLNDKIAPEAVGASGVATLNEFPYQIFPGASGGRVLNAHERFPLASEVRKFNALVGGT